MQGSPLRKKARFSEHPQIFEYSSKSKKQNQTDNQSLLLDMNEDDSKSKQKIQRVEQKQELDSNAQHQLQIDQITSDLAQIQAYLNQESKPIIQDQNNGQTQPTLTPLKSPINNININLRPELRSGRETMNLQQQIRVRSTIKQMQQDDISNNKKRAMKQETKEKQKAKNIEQRLGEEIKKNKRITMDVKQLMNILNQYSTQDEQRKIKQQRKNRITMDVYALSKFLQDVDEEKDEENNHIKTPIKTLDKSIRKNKVFSAFKQAPHSAEIKVFVSTYIAQVSKRIQQKQQNSRKLSQYLSQLKSELLKTELKISDARKRAQRRNQQKHILQRQLKSISEQLNKKKYIEDLQYIRNVEAEFSIKILKCEIDDSGCYGHFIFDGIFMKVKSKSKFSGIDLKLLVSGQARRRQKFFLISIDDSLKLLKKYSSKLQQNCSAFLQSVIKVRNGYRKIQKLDNDLYYFSLSFALKQFELSSSLEKLSFQVFIGTDKYYLFEINMFLYLSDELDSNCVAIYDPSKPGYLKIDVQAKKFDSIIFEKMNKIISLGLF